MHKRHPYIVIEQTFIKYRLIILSNVGIIDLFNLNNKDLIHILYKLIN